ncbi:hypothetical protein BD408DRAFT_121012 [Parasitella parasitica]|nr:hypothetical protein BD408DRAFT_121012 [Parasitella parasitica]
MISRSCKYLDCMLFGMLKHFLCFFTLKPRYHHLLGWGYSDTMQCHLSMHNGIRKPLLSV